MFKNGCLTLEQLNEMLYQCQPNAWVAPLCAMLRPNEHVSIITGRGTEHAQVTQDWVREHVPHSPIHIQLLGDQIFFPGQPTDWVRYQNIKGQAIDDAIALASARRQPGEWILVLEDDPRVIADVLFKHLHVPGLVVGAVGGLGKIHIVHKNGSGSMDARWLRLTKVIA
jgi:hypothetical protein